MPGKICKVIAGVHKDKTVTVENKQDQAFIKAGKVHVHFFNGDDPYLKGGKHVNGLIATDKLQPVGYYD